VLLAVSSLVVRLVFPLCHNGNEEILDFFFKKKD